MRQIVFKALVWKELVFLQYYWVRINFKATTQKKNPRQWLPKVSLKKWLSRSPEVHWEILDSCFHSNDLPYQLSYMLFNQISGHEKLFTTLLAQESNENTKFTKTGLKLDGCFLLQYGCRSDCPEKFFITSSVSWKSNCLETCYRIVDSYF